MKIALSFICGAVICYMVVIGVKPVLPAMADVSSGDTVSDNNTSFLTHLMPDFDKIYRDSLSEPFIKAESKIHDEDIRDYYRGLMDKTGLTDPTTD